MNAQSSPNPALAWLYVIAQFALIAACLWGTSTSLLNGGNTLSLIWVAAAVLVLTGIALGLSALWAMGSNTFSVLPTPVPTGSLCESGPYRWICHPMYTAVLLVCLAACVVKPEPIRGVIWIALLMVLVGKLRYEEALLETRFEQYREFRQARHRLIPGIW